MKIYTKTGDAGETALYGGKRVVKHHHQIEAYGTVDELNSYIGLVRGLTQNTGQDAVLSQIQHILFDIGAHLAADPKKPKLKKPELSEQDIVSLENNIDFMNEQLAPLTQFILPGGHATVSHIHIARTICRRAERKISKAQKKQALEIDKLIIPYINRLSDYLFVLARYAAKQH